MRFTVLLFIISLLLMSCKKGSVEPRIVRPTENMTVDDSAFIRYPEFPKGDIRRYGVFPDSTGVEEFLQKAIELSSKGLRLSFPKGYYPINMDLMGRTNVSIKFHDAIIGGRLNIHQSAQENSSVIELLGKLTVLDRVFIRRSDNIHFDSVFIKTALNRNLLHRANRGLSIYSGSKFISFDYLNVSDTGGDGTDYFKHTAAAIQVHGWNNNPTHIRAKKILIKNAARTGIYLTGSNHHIVYLEVENFGLGNHKNIKPLEDAKKGEEKLFAASWINVATDCIIDTLSLKSTENKGDYSLKLGRGKPFSPANIEFLEMDEITQNMPILDSPLTNIIINKSNVGE